jgi:3-methyladenine DNA glycosylase/8-oxoguanine DNA glycosylase
MVEALVVNYGSPLPEDEALRAFPSPERLAAVDVAALRTTARLGYRAPYVVELAQSVVSGTLDLESLKTTALSTPDLHKHLLSIKGVGAYAAASVLMLLGRYDFVPVDSWARKLVSHEWYNGESVSKAQIEQAFERWGEWKGLAYWFWDWTYTEEQ